MHRLPRTAPRFPLARAATTRALVFLIAFAPGALPLVLATRSSVAVAAAAESTTSVAATTDAALIPPMIAFHIRDGHGRPLAPSDESDVLADLPGLAVLDTGSSTLLLSHDTALRFGVRADPGARWVETGLDGEHAFAVSTPTTLALDATPPLLLSAQRLLLNDVPEDPSTMLANPGAIVDVIGMPALEHAIAEIRFDGGELGLPAVSLLAPGGAVRADRWFTLALVDFNHRRHPGNRGASPTVSTNPVLRGVHVVRGADDVRGDWLLDTGSAVTMLSTTAARALGLAGRAPLSAPVGGIAGGEQALPGWRVDRIELPASDGGVITVRDAAIFVRDITTTGDDGTRTTLDGIVGANLLAAFARVVIDVPHARLGLDMPPATATDVRTPRTPRQ